MGPLWYLHLRLQYGINLTQYANIGVTWAICSIVANLILLPLLMKCLDDISLIFLSILTTAIASILWTVGHSYLYALLLGPLFAFYQPIEIILHSCISKLISEHEVGTAFSFLAVLSKCIDFFAKPSYGFLYRATLDWFPGTFLLVSTGCLGIIFILMLLVQHGLTKRKLNQSNNM